MPDLVREALWGWGQRTLSPGPPPACPEIHYCQLPWSSPARPRDCSLSGSGPHPPRAKEVRGRLCACFPNNLPPDVWVGDTTTLLIREESDLRPSPISAPARWGHSKGLHSVSLFSDWFEGMQLDSCICCPLELRDALMWLEDGKRPGQSQVRSLKRRDTGFDGTKPKGQKPPLLNGWGHLQPHSSPLPLAQFKPLDLFCI